MAGRVTVRQVRVLLGKAGEACSGSVGRGQLRHGRHGWSRCAKACSGMERFGMAGTVRSGWQVRVRSGQDGHGKVWQARMAGRVWYWPGVAGAAGCVSVRKGWAGQVGSGK
jgi:hypothetical protein